MIRSLQENWVLALPQKVHSALNVALPITTGQKCAIEVTISYYRGVCSIYNFRKIENIRNYKMIK